MKIKGYFILFQVIFISFLHAEPRMSCEEYISLYKDDAVHDMLKTGVPASITLAQAMLESDNGNSELAREANNHFGIKCHAEWNGETHYQDDDKQNECFRKYKSVLESYDDHSEFLRTRQRYSFLFSYDRADYVSWARGLKKAGYATNPQYAERLIKIIEENNLHAFDAATTSDNVEYVSVSTPVPVKQRFPTEPITEVAISEQRSVSELNRTQYIVARPGDTYQTLATEFDLMPWQILKYNDLKKTDRIKGGEIVFLKPKRSKAQSVYCIMEEGQTLRDVSQKYGVKVKALYRYNRIEEGFQPAAGEKIWLNKKKPG
jgi:LysM repeat protein